MRDIIYLLLALGFVLSQSSILLLVLFTRKRPPKFPRL